MKTVISFFLPSTGLIAAEGAFWKDQRNLVVKWLRELGMMKFGSKRETMQNRIMIGISLCLEKFAEFTSQEINPAHIIMDTVGNVVNDFVFGVTYDWDDATWKHLKHLQEEGVKYIGVGAGANFLPILRLSYKYCINHNMFHALHFSNPIRQISSH